MLVEQQRTIIGGIRSTRIGETLGGRSATVQEGTIFPFLLTEQYNFNTQVNAMLSNKTETLKNQRAYFNYGEFSESLLIMILKSWGEMLTKWYFNNRPRHFGNV